MTVFARLWSLLQGQAKTDEWRATHQHKKGGLYRVICQGLLEADETPVVIYDDIDGKTWVRPSSEFFDGRFTPR